MDQDTRNLAKDLQEQISSCASTCREERNKITELIQRVKNYLMGQCLLRFIN